MAPLHSNVMEMSGHVDLMRHTVRINGNVIAVHRLC